MEGRKVILAVDDATESLSLIKMFLQNEFDVRTSKSPTMALEMIKREGLVDLILLDIEMPTMSGFEFLEILHSTVVESVIMPVIFVTSHASENFVAHAISKGASDYIVKPIQEEVLIKKIEAILKK